MNIEMLQSWLWLTFVLSVELCLNLSDDLIVKFLSPRQGETLEMTLKCREEVPPPLPHRSCRASIEPTTD